MKNPANRNKFPNSSISIQSRLTDSSVLLCLVEMLAERRYDIGYGSQETPPGWKAIETSCIEAYVNGKTILSHPAGKINYGFTTSFLFTCTKEKGQEYGFNWLCSLS